MTLLQLHAATDGSANPNQYIVGVPSIGDPKYAISARHLDGAKVCFVDGHSKWFKTPGVLTKDDTLWGLQ